MDPGPSAVTCCQPRGQKSRLSLPPLQGTSVPMGACETPSGTPKHPVRTSDMGVWGHGTCWVGQMANCPSEQWGDPGRGGSRASWEPLPGACDPSRHPGYSPAVAGVPQARAGAEEGPSIHHGQRLLAPEDGKQRDQGPRSHRNIDP